MPGTEWVCRFPRSGLQDRDSWEGGAGNIGGGCGGEQKREGSLQRGVLLEKLKLWAPGAQSHGKTLGSGAENVPESYPPNE